MTPLTRAAPVCLLLIGLCLAAGPANCQPPAPSGLLYREADGRARPRPAARPPVAQRRAPVAPQEEEAEEPVGRRLKAIEGRLDELEAAPTRSLDECAQWFDLSQRFGRLTRGRAPVRQFERRKQDECDSLERAVAAVRKRLSGFRRLLNGEAGRLGHVARLVDEYRELSDARDPILRAELAALLDADGRTARDMQQVGEFVEEMGALAEEPAADRPVDALDQLATPMKRLIEREDHLSETDLDQLTALSERLERALADGRSVPFVSGRFRYLSGLLDGAKAVVLRRTVQAAPAELAADSAEEELDSAAPALVPSATAPEDETAAAAEGGRDEEGGGAAQRATEAENGSSEEPGAPPTERQRERTESRSAPADATSAHAAKPSDGGDLRAATPPRAESVVEPAREGEEPSSGGQWKGGQPQQRPSASGAQSAAAGAATGGGPAPPAGAPQLAAAAQLTGGVRGLGRRRPLSGGR